ncbi:NAD(P)/FAD-dependent oxidoreductase [Catenovulum maritimum]|uniref:Pyridine nucleotide-disulfide oxidoreductase n=1 Tax=Catenovulum maritimum TaxID=1513271 RepID=A0A0J8GT45_9ALTE|nr:FAD/NAD(P)-binding oxidoreductase [Catenovulum maritimum]KMT64464.1 pyridine nucleotide-disulfide oxidoreductase [Catenovulum maritimum]
MSDKSSLDQTCIIIGASHAGVNLAFSLRKEGWQGEIKLFDADPILPYHRPPLSKAYLTSDDEIDKNALKSAESYDKENINLNLGVSVTKIDAESEQITLSDNTVHGYDKLVIATGARPLIPPITGIETATHLYPLRTALDVSNIRKAFNQSKQKRVVIIGGGYIGLETAASLKKLGAKVTVLEREDRILARVTAPEMSAFFAKLHADNDVDVFTGKNVTQIQNCQNENTIICADGSSYQADIIIVGVGIRVNTELAADAGIELENGIKVDETTATSAANIYAIGDCSYHYNPHYDRFIRLESVQNAVDQAKTAAAAINGKQVKYDTLPWFWSDQHDVKLQMVGLSQGYNQIVVRQELDAENKFSVWYFDNDTLLSVDAVNNAKAYVLGTKFIKSSSKLDKAKLADANVELKPANLIQD